MARIDKLLKFIVDSKASDLHISAGSPPRIRQFSELKKTNAPVMDGNETHSLLMETLSPTQQGHFKEHQSVDFCYEVAGIGRFRANVFQQRLGVGGAFRALPEKPPSLESLNMPPAIERLLDFQQGLILVTGPAGCGKTTTLGGMLNHINEKRDEHIITVEDPVEIVHKSKQCVVTHREVGLHTDSFQVALRAALREDPDVILVGEMRDLETIQMAITSAETGHLVLATLHTASAARTINRIIDVFPPEQMPQIRAMVSESIRGVISQQLLVRADGKGMQLCLEVMLATPAIAHLIRENRAYQIPSLMQIGSSRGMKLMDETLLEYVQVGIITPETAFSAAENKGEFQERLGAMNFSQVASEEEEIADFLKEE